MTNTYLTLPFVLRIDAKRPTYGWRTDGYSKRSGGAMEWRILCPELSKGWLRVRAVCVSNVASYFVKAGGQVYWLSDSKLQDAVDQARADEAKRRTELAK